MSILWNDLAKRIHELHGKDEFLPLHEPTLTGNEMDYVVDCIETGWVSSVGKYVDKIEEMLAEYTGVERAVAVVNGTAALHIALKIVGVQQGDEVLIPSLTFVATGNAVTYCNADPHFIDVSEETLGVDPNKLDDYLNDIVIIKEGKSVNKHTGKIIRAIVPMHTFGHPVDLDSLMEVCERYNITIVEDAAESLGSLYKGKHTGSFGKVSALSFNGNKIMTTGGGGAILTNDENLANYAKHLTTTAKVPHAWEYIHDEIGYNYRMPNINAALGCAQLESIDNFITNKRNLTNMYEDIINNYDGISLFKEKSNMRSNYWLQTLIIDDSKHNIEEALEILNNNNIMSRPIWQPLHLLEPFKAYQKSDLSTTELLKKQIINIPSSPYLGSDKN